MIVPRIHEREEAYILQNEDNRIVFVIPISRITLIGTTDVEHKGSLRRRRSAAPRSTICSGQRPLHQADKPGGRVWDLRRVRPLCDDGIRFRPQAGDPGLHPEPVASPTGAALSVFGGKLTTYRKPGPGRLQQASASPGSARWERTGPPPRRLPGGEFDCPGARTGAPLRWSSRLAR